LLKIRLSRTGKKGQPSFRVIVQEHTASPKRGKIVENLGSYLPARDPKIFEVKLDRVEYWLSVGAHPSDTVASLLKKHGVKGVEKFMELRNKKKKKKNPSEEELAKQAPKAEAPKTEVVVETPAEKVVVEAPKEEAAVEAPVEEVVAEAPKEEVSE